MLVKIAICAYAHMITFSHISQILICYLTYIQHFPYDCETNAPNHPSIWTYIQAPPPDWSLLVIKVDLDLILEYLMNNHGIDTKDG